METTNASTFPSDIAVSHVALFKLPSSLAATLHASIMSAARAPDDAGGDAARQLVDFAFLDGAMLVARRHVATAVWQAQLAISSGSAKSKNRHAEVVYRLALGTNIGDALKTFGLNAKSQYLVLVHLTAAEPQGPSPASMLERMQALVPGAELLPLDALGAQGDVSDWTRIVKAYRLGASLGGAPADKVEERRKIEGWVTGAVALKSVAA